MSGKRTSVPNWPPKDRTLPLGSMGYENGVNERGERLIWLEAAAGIGSADYCM
jgi:hypothetical protein